MRTSELAASVKTTQSGVIVTTGPATVEPGRLDLVIVQGATFSLRIAWQDQSAQVRDITGYTARLKSRTTWGDTTAHVSLTSAAGITLSDGTQGYNIAIAMTATETAALTFLRDVYDLELVSGSTVTRLLEGSVTLRKEATT